MAFIWAEVRKPGSNSALVEAASRGHTADAEDALDVVLQRDNEVDSLQYM